MITVNKFVTLNMMQTFTTKCADMGECWELKVTIKKASVIRTRVVAFIRKQAGEYLVTLTGEYHKTFMGALASLMPYYVGAMKKLVMSMACPVGYKTSDFENVVEMAVTEILNPGYSDFVKPNKPIYDRGDKKEALHPLRRAVTKLIGKGKYSR